MFKQRDLLWRKCIRRGHLLPRTISSLLFCQFHNVRLPSLQLFDSAVQNQNKTAVISDHQSFTYGQLLADSGKIADELSQMFGSNVLNGRRVSFLFDPSYAYVVYQWAVWRSGAVAVPLCNTHPTEELDYYISDSQSDVVFYDQKFESLIAPLKTNRIIFKSVPVKDLIANSKHTERKYDRFEDVSLSSNGMFVYTSGTTGKPKGVVTTHSQIQSQTKSLVDAWKWTSNDHILHVLPLHHVHGIINCLTCALWSGAIVEFMKFNAEDVWKRFTQEPHITLFMAVPTIYVKLISAFEQFDEKKKNEYANAAASLRLMVSGSAALPEPVFDKWKEITGHVILERYGMTEIGMALSNPYDNRKPGYVGIPLPGVQTKIVDENGNEVKQGEPGELLVKGPSVFKEYWQRKEATAQAFDDGWFKTGDIAVIDPESCFYKILGRSSVDIIKYAGYKISALEVERGKLIIEQTS
jgi:malonyl-CoA/methylmalonyl-CoA synthetase